MTLKFYNIDLDWFVLGVCLYISEEELLRIDKENNNKPRKCIIKLFSYWLKLRRRGNWNDILAALTHAGDREYAISIMSGLKTEDMNRKGIIVIDTKCAIIIALYNRSFESFQPISEQPCEIPTNFRLVHPWSST